MSCLTRRTFQMYKGSLEVSSCLDRSNKSEGDMECCERWLNGGRS